MTELQLDNEWGNLPKRVVRVTGPAPNIKAMATEFYRPFTRPRPGRGTFVIGICGAAGAGKNTVAEHLVRKYSNFTLVPSAPFDSGKIYIRQYALADSLKEEVFDWLHAQSFINSEVESIGAFDETLYLQGAVNKIEYVNNNKVRLRQLLQKWGTEYRRKVESEYWIDRLLERIAEESPQVAMITDVRFTNELAICHAAIKVEKIGQRKDATVSSHVSEQEWRAFDFRQNVVRAAEGDFETLRTESERVFERIVRDFHVQ